MFRYRTKRHFDHVREGTQRDNIPKSPTIFFRCLTSMVPHLSPIIRPLESEQLDYEAPPNGATMQSGTTDNMMFPLIETLVYLTRAMTLEPGDLIVTGTPSGVGFVRNRRSSCAPATCAKSRSRASAC